MIIIRAKNPGDVYGANKLHHENWAVVQGMIIVLQPAHDGTKLLEVDKYVTSSLVLPTIRKIIYYADPIQPMIIPWSATFETIVHDDLPIEVQRAREVYHDDLVRRHIDEIDTCSHHFWSNCTLLDPRFKSLNNVLGLSLTEKTDARAAFDSLYKMHWADSDTMELSSDSDPEDNVLVAPPSPPAPPARNETAVCGRRSHADLVSFLSPQAAAATEHAQPESNNVRDELELYFALPDAPLETDPLCWWPMHEKLLPSLSRMARQFLGVPASSAAVERLFRGVGQDFAKQRQAMSEHTLEELTWARSFIRNKHKRE